MVQSSFIELLFRKSTDVLAKVEFITGSNIIEEKVTEKVTDAESEEEGGFFEALKKGLKKTVFAHSDLDSLRQKLQAARDDDEVTGATWVVTDGVFSMRGDLAPLDQICDLADQYDALVMVDDSHATGFLGPNGRGTPEHFGVSDRIDVITSTLGKALGGASGGFTTGRQEIIDYLRQLSRPYLFSNTLAPPIAAASIKAIDLA